jgi:UrcA family protein
MFDRHIAIALLSAGLTFAWAAPSSAAPVAAETIHVSVRSSDLDLASQSGRTVLQGRIANAVARICGSHPRTTAEAEQYENCSTAARADAASQFDTLVAAAENARQMATAPAKSAPVR